MDDVAKIARGMSEAQKALPWLAHGRKQVPATVVELYEAGLLNVAPMPAGWVWHPTPLGELVRAHLQEKNDG